MAREKDFWDFDRPADWTLKDEAVRAALYAMATRRQYEEEREKSMETEDHD